MSSRSQITHQLQLPFEAKKFRVTFSWLVAKKMSRVVEARNAEEAEQLAETLDDEDWAISESDVDGSDETRVEEAPAESSATPKPNNSPSPT
jgi:hypothetical protein